MLATPGCQKGKLEHDPFCPEKGKSEPTTSRCTDSCLALAHLLAPDRCGLKAKMVSGNLALRAVTHGQTLPDSQ
jgi:hypothetical protein